MDADLAARLEALEDRQAISDLYFNYLWLVDSREWERVTEECFAADAELQLGTIVKKGRAEIAEIFTHHMARFHRTAHYFTNSVVRLNGDGTASSRGYILSWHWDEEPSADDPTPQADTVGVGVYIDELRKEDGRWWMTRRNRRNLGPGSLGIGIPRDDFFARASRAVESGDKA